MLRLTRFDAVAVPRHFEAQIRALAEAEWPGIEQDDAQPLTDPALRPVPFVLSEEEQVLSYARTIRARIPHAGGDLQLFGLGDVVTRAGYRRMGYGSRVVHEATEYIRSDPQADAAILLTRAELEPLYRRSGWENAPKLRVVTGEQDTAKATVPMLLLLSSRGRTALSSRLGDTLVLPGDEW